MHFIALLRRAGGAAGGQGGLPPCQVIFIPFNQPDINCRYSFFSAINSIKIK